MQDLGPSCTVPGRLFQGVKGQDRQLMVRVIWQRIADPAANVRLLKQSRNVSPAAFLHEEGFRGCLPESGIELEKIKYLFFLCSQNTTTNMKTSHTRCVWNFPHTPSKPSILLWIPAGCRLIQSNSDTKHLKIVSNPISLGLSPQDYCLHSPRCQSQTPPTSNQQAINWGSHVSLFRFN